MRSPSAITQHVAGHEVDVPRPRLRAPSRSTVAPARQIALQSLDRALGLLLLERRRTPALSDDHDHDRDGHRRLIPATAASAAAAQSSSASGWVNWRRSSLGHRTVL